MDIHGKIFGFWLMLFALLLAVGCTPKAILAPQNEVPADIEEHAQQLIAGLSKQGYEIARGYPRMYAINDCPYSFEIMKSCFGNNPAAPYITFAVPPWPEEFVDPATRFAWGRTLEGYGSSYRLDPREAIIVFGILPPEAAYFGMQTYLFTRQGSFDKTSSQYTVIEDHFPNMLDFFFALVPKNPDRIQVIASLSNSINNVVIERKSGAAFDQERFFIITPDQFMDRTVRKALDKIAGGDVNLFTEPIPSTTILGLDEKADEFITAIRYAMPFDTGKPGAPSDTWRNNPPLVILRVRDTKKGRSPEPYSPVVLETRTAADESWLATDFVKLIQEVNHRWGQPCGNDDCSDRATSFTDLQSLPITLVGPACTKIGMNCLGDTQDTTYQATFNLSLDEGEIYAVAGTLGTETGNATYVGLSINDSLMLKGIGNIDSETLENTALDYADKVDNTDKFYVYYFTRDCSDLQALTGGNCFSVSEAMIPPCSDPASASCSHLKLIQREYIRQGSQRGPDSSLTLNPQLIILKRK